jgi:ABC-type dipeptide/oligopeptide/nickel transport system permease component
MMSHIRMILTRLVLQGMPTLFGAVTVLFFVLRVLPGDPAQILLGADARPEDLIRLRQQLGLDQPLLHQYATFIRDFFTGNWGVSLATQDPVIDRMAAELPHTLVLCFAALFTIVAISIPAGVLCAVGRDTWMDYTISSIVFLLMSMPQFWLGLLLLLVFSYWLAWLPIFGAGASGDVFDQLIHLILPTLTLAASFLGVTTRLTRSAMLEVLDRDYIQTARAKGLSETRVILKHGLRNALLPVITVLALTMGQLFGGAVIVEVVFSRPGVGTLIWDAILQRDYPQVQASVAAFAAMFIFTNFVADALYGILNPRVSES